VIFNEPDNRLTTFESILSTAMKETQGKREREREREIEYVAM